MPRYIDADRLLTKIHELYVQPNIELWQVVKCVGNSPTADVAPKSEVAKEIFEEIEKEIVAALNCNYKRRTEYYTKERYTKEDGEFINTVNGKIDALRGIEGFVEELKKKYTEVEK